MELAGQWRREWAGTAEYGKVTEGGITRRIARAMEVLDASGPGAQVRVMRAAYHSTSAPGVPASSYMLHSSRRVISSGFDLMNTPTSITKPLEISSTPLESLPDSSMGIENYKVTEPDDIEISEPSKWRSARSDSSLRMLSEESSSTENASIIDLDTRYSHKGLHRKYSNDSENSDVNSFRQSSSRTSPLLHDAATLSTLKYKSLLNSSDEWNNRRKSYSFEDTSPLNEVILQSNDTLAMESSTDSGICKSSEIVNDFTEDTRKRHTVDEKTQDSYTTDRFTDEWHMNNNIYKRSAFKPYADYFVEVGHRENNIALQSRGKVSINVPITIEDDDNNLNTSQTNDDGERKVKKVGFCKTELHFAAESGKVNIIATDDKPPPTNDFRKRRSAFVPINEKFEKSITLFGDKNDFLISNEDEYGVKGFHESMEIEDNTAATKSILKNRIPKPKPYLLGENMVFGDSGNAGLSSDEYLTSAGVSFINKQLQIKRNDVDEENFMNFSTTSDKSFRDSKRTVKEDPLKVLSSANGKYIQGIESVTTENKSQNNSIRNNIKFLQMSPVQKTKTRQLRASELTYFGIDDNNKKGIFNATRHTDSLQSIRSQTEFLDNAFESVRLIKQISNSAQNSEVESDESPDYQNIPIKNNFAPVPTPRSRVKYKNSDEKITILKPIIERANETAVGSHESRRSRSKKHELTIVPTSRSLSEPPNKNSDTAKRGSRKDNSQQRCKDRKKTEENLIPKATDDLRKSLHTIMGEEEDIRLYANVNKNKKDLQKQTVANVYKDERRNRLLENNKEERTSKLHTDSPKKKQSTVEKPSRQRTEKLSTPEYSTNEKNPDSSILRKAQKENRNECKENHSCRTKKHEERSHKVRSNPKDTKDAATGVKLPKRKSEDKAGSYNRRTEPPKIIPGLEKESSHKITDPVFIEHATKSKDLKVVDQVETDKNALTNGRRTARKSEYVIKYDDKNGTVSSISKVRAGHGTTKQKHVSKELNKNNMTDSKTKKRNAEMSALRNAAPRSSQDCKRKKGI